MVKPVKLKIEIDHKSLKEIEDLFDKFKITWDDKVYKKVDDLGDSLDKLSKIMRDVWRQTANKQYQQAKGNINPNVQKMIDAMINEFEKSTKTIVESIDKTTEAMDKFQGGVSSAGDGMLTFEQQMDKLEASTAKELAIRDKMTIQMRERYRLRRELSEFEEAGRKERQASRGWMNMFGGSGSIGGQLTKIFKPFIKDAFKPMQDVFKVEEFQKTPAGMKAERLKYSTSPAFPMQRMAGQAAYQKAGIDDPDKARKGGAGMFGGLKKWLGGRAEAHEKGGIAGMMGGAKGMVALGGALIGIKLLQKAITLGIQSSPMMQQMLKLWKFGIMMIFRPIGDFFGFFLRPIFVALLRKFIIPFYQTYLPMMQEMGHKLGEDVANNLIWILEMLSGIRYVTDGAYRTQVDAASAAEAHAGMMHADLSSLISVEEAMTRKGYSVTGEVREDSPDHGRYATEGDMTAQTITMKEAIEQSIDQNRSWWTESGLLGEDMPDWLKQGLGALETTKTVNNINETNSRNKVNVDQDNTINITINTENLDDAATEDLITTLTHEAKLNQKKLWRSGGIN